MSKITATFDGLQINIEGGESVTAHQLWIASRILDRHGALVDCLPDTIGKEYTIVVLLKGFEPIISRTPDIEPAHQEALIAEFALAAQHIFSLPRLGAVIQSTVQMTLQAIAEQAQAQQIMAGVKKSPGGVLTPH